MARAYQRRDAEVAHPFDDVPGLPCREEPDAWFPEQGNSGNYASLMCGRCPITDACLAFALETGQGFGYWGGMSADGRRNLKPEQRAFLIDAGRAQLRELTQ